MENYSVNRCTRCGRQLTMEEDSAFNPPTCMNCAREHVATVKSDCRVCCNQKPVGDPSCRYTVWLVGA